jgi:hypothetical protein
MDPRQHAVRLDALDATLCVDAEGEICGMWKRHLNPGNYWVMGG